MFDIWKYDLDFSTCRRTSFSHQEHFQLIYLVNEAKGSSRTLQILNFIKAFCGIWRNMRGKENGKQLECEIHKFVACDTGPSSPFSFHLSLHFTPPKKGWARNIPHLCALQPCLCFIDRLFALLETMTSSSQNEQLYSLFKHSLNDLVKIKRQFYDFGELCIAFVAWEFPMFFQSSYYNDCFILWFD